MAVISSIVTNNREKQLKELKEHLLDRNHSQYTIYDSFAKIFQPKFQTRKSGSTAFIRTYNPNHSINFKKFNSCLDKIENKELKIFF